VEEAYTKDMIHKRIRWLILSRVFIASFILGVAAFAEFNTGGQLSDLPGLPFFKIILCIYPLSLGYYLLCKYFRNIALHVYLQSSLDIFAVTAMVYSTGGIESLYSVFYPIVIIYSVIFLGRRGGLLIATAAGAFYSFLAMVEYHGIITPPLSSSLYEYRLQAGYVWTRIVTHILSFYFTAFLSIFVVEQERKTRNLLAEKQDAFAKLDILHKSIIDSVNLGILTVNNAGQIKSFNRAATEITGLAFNDIANRSFSDIFPDLHAFIKDQKMKDGAFSPSKVFEGTFHTNAGRELNLASSLSPLRDQHGNVIGEIIILRDITELLEIRNLLEKNRRLALVGGIAANLTHEIRNPLASIGGAIQLLKQDFPQSDVNDKLFQIILRGKDQLDAFLKDFLLMTKPAPGICEEIDINAVIKEVVDSLRLVPEWPQPLKLHLNLPEQPVFIHVNRKEIRQVFWNVILNSLQAMPDGGELKVEVSPCRLKEGDAVEIRIEDSGCGIDGQDLQRIFEPFYTSKDMGTGLGLAVVNRIIENWKGTINVKSEKEQGTVFLLTIPVHVL
jgi:two-component system, NtrC family, sensor histidine kinase PilS